MAQWLIGAAITAAFTGLVIWTWRRDPDGTWHERPGRQYHPDEDSPMATPGLVPLTDQQAAYWSTVMADHADRERYGCQICRFRDCPRHREAKANLAMAGRVDWDPIRDRRQLR